MAIHALRDTAERGHLVGDVPGILIAGVLLLLLAPRNHSVKAVSVFARPTQLVFATKMGYRQNARIHVPCKAGI